ncbi:MAG: hypothetical protein ABH862_01010 [Candidatus Omnitrophota bacterium]
MKDYIGKIDKFLGYRVFLLHKLSAPRYSIEKIEEMCDKAFELYKEAGIAHGKMFKALAPYRFSSKELKHFYGKKNDGKWFDIFEEKVLFDEMFL